MTQFNFTVPDIDCAACIRSITSAVHKVDSGAAVEADLEAKRVTIAGQGTEADFAAAIEKAGFTATATS